MPATVGMPAAIPNAAAAACGSRPTRPEGATRRAHLAAGAWVRIDPRTLAIGADGALYVHFAGKADLLASVCERLLPDLHAVMGDLVNRVGAATVAENLEAIAVTALRPHHSQPTAPRVSGIPASVPTSLAAGRRLHLAVAFGILALFAASLTILAVSLRRAERLRRQQLEFVAGVTHELHTPLAALASAGQNLADGIQVDTAKYGETIVKETRRLTDLLDDVLQFAAIESHSTAARTTEVDVREVVDDAIAQCRWLADAQHVRVESAAPESLPRMQADRGAVTRAVQNLVANAIRHGRDGGWVGVRTAVDGGHVLITVQDRGPGIPAADLPHLFEPFSRGRNAQTPGSGLGLTIVRGVAEAHDGSVQAANRHAGGAEFMLGLSVQRATQ